MKKYLSILALSVLLVACQNQNQTNITKETATPTPIVDTKKCVDIIQYDDTIYGNVFGYKNINNAEISLLEEDMEKLDIIQSCGEDLNKKLKNDTYYLIEAIERYHDQPELINKLLSYNVSTDIVDRNGNNVYTIALAMNVKDEDLLNVLSKDLTKEEIENAKNIVKLTLYGSELSIDDIKKFKEKGISLNQSLSDYSYTYMDDNMKYEGGTILGSALLNQDYEKVKWLLENGADPKLSFGVAEHEISPLNYALSHDLKIAELLLQYKFDLNEISPSHDAPVESTFLAEYSCNEEAVALLKKYGATKWYYTDEGIEINQQEMESRCQAN